MSESISKPTANDEQPAQQQRETRQGEAKTWETPKMEDVSEQVMAQPYIRFT